MESIKEKIHQFLSINSGYGFGSEYGDGSCFSNGSGYGRGYGNGDGSGNGFGSGSGNGSGCGCNKSYGYGCGSKGDIESINGHKIYVIDGVQTIINAVIGNIAKGFILHSDFTQTPTYIAKYGNYFAHGETKEEAIRSAQYKYDYNLPVEQRLKLFNEAYPDRKKKIPASELFEWHRKLTGSCEQGRIAFCKGMGLDYKNGEYTVNEFIELTKDAYGCDIIRRL